MRYRRADVCGGTYFFTVNLLDPNSSLLIDEIDLLRTSINKVKKQQPFKLDAMVVLPEHLHALFTLPENDNDFATRWMLIKSGFSRQLPKKETISNSRKAKGERGIWQRRYWEHLIRDDEDFAKHVDYIHYNPVKHGHVSRAINWPYSSIHRYLERGLLHENWASDNSHEADFGEPNTP